ncbi:MAG: family 43 glycosylhydrolase [Clostridia bacterium]|nr:family 43 glycosylhydrolase [Clostridia bacterium]
MKRREEIRIRDPFIYTDREAGCYYMYGTTDFVSENSPLTARRFTVYRSLDLENFDDGKTIFDGEKNGFWGTMNYWAPEMHKYRGKYYLFATFKSEDRHRGTQILVSDAPDGEFRPISDGPATPHEWECLDGTLFIDGDVPYMVFSHEWTEIKDGAICAVRLSDDLSRTIGEPVTLFHASDNASVTELHAGSGNYVTDGPFLYREDGKIKMIWSSFEHGRYLVIGAYADTLTGKWTHTPSLFDFNGGHAMIFESLSGERMISLHSPNHAGLERAVFHKI